MKQQTRLFINDLILDRRLAVAFLKALIWVIGWLGGVLVSFNSANGVGFGGSCLIFAMSLGLDKFSSEKNKNTKLGSIILRIFYGVIFLAIVMPVILLFQITDNYYYKLVLLIINIVIVMFIIGQFIFTLLLSESSSGGLNNSSSCRSAETNQESINLAQKFILNLNNGNLGNINEEGDRG